MFFLLFAFWSFFFFFVSFSNFCFDRQPKKTKKTTTIMSENGEWKVWVKVAPTFDGKSILTTLSPEIGVGELRKRVDKLNLLEVFFCFLFFVFCFFVFCFLFSFFPLLSFSFPFFPFLSLSFPFFPSYFFSFSSGRLLVFYSKFETFDKK